MRFTKMQGCGNDYIYVDCFSERVERPEELAREISDRHFGVGGDGLILIERSGRADAYMHMFNQDGSEGNMCGNGIRCTAKYLYEHGLIPKERREVLIDTKSGIRKLSLRLEDGKVREVTVDMGEARLTSELPERITVSGLPLSFIGIDVGNPHAVYFLEDNPALKERGLSALDLSRLGETFERHERFPERVNSEFIEVLSPSELNFRVYERGSGETFACGTGATAAVAAGILSGKLSDEVKLHLLGGDLTIRYERSDGHYYMTGPAEEVFSGEWKR